MPPLTPPPDRNPRKPKLKTPAGAVDTHIHLFGPASKYPFHAASKYISEDILPAHAIALQKALGLATSIIISGGGYGTDYRHLADVLREFPDRFRGVALLPPRTTSDEIAMLDQLGVRGARFVSARHGAHLPQLVSSSSLIDRVVAAGWHIQFYPHRTDLPDFKDQLLSLGTDIVLDHFAHIPAEGGVDQQAFRCLLGHARQWPRLGETVRPDAVHDRRAALSKCHSPGPSSGTPRTGPLGLGVRLAACQHDRPDDAQRRRTSRPAA